MQPVTGATNAGRGPRRGSSDRIAGPEGDHAASSRSCFAGGLSSREIWQLLAPSHEGEHALDLAWAPVMASADRVRRVGFEPTSAFVAMVFETIAFASLATAARPHSRMTRRACEPIRCARSVNFAPGLGTAATFEDTMCGRYTLTNPDPVGLRARFDILESIEVDDEPRYNIAPTDPVLAVRPVRRRSRPRPAALGAGSRRLGGEEGPTPADQRPGRNPCDPAPRSPSRFVSGAA